LPELIVAYLRGIAGLKLQKGAPAPAAAGATPAAGDEGDTEPVWGLEQFFR
jgi:hypothetical protein